MTLVIVRKFQGELTAFFPEEPGTNDLKTMMSYSSMGQHSAASVECLEESTETTQDDREEVARLIQELKNIGYDDLKVEYRYHYDSLWNWRVKRYQKIQAIK